MARNGLDTVIFDLGGVLIDWDPRHLYRKLFAATMPQWNIFSRQFAPVNGTAARTAGRSFAEGARLLKAEHPDKAELIDAYGSRFDEMIAGPIAGSIEILAELRDRGTRSTGSPTGRPKPFRRCSIALRFSAGSGGFSSPARPG